MDDFFVGALAQDGGNFGCLQPANPPDVVGTVVAQPPGELLSLGIPVGDDIAFAEMSVDLDDPDGQEAAAGALDGASGAGIDDEPAAGLDGIADPAFPGGQGLAPGEEGGADLPPLQRFARSFENPGAKPLLAVLLLDQGDPDLRRAELAALPRRVFSANSRTALHSPELVAQAGWHVDLAHPGYVARLRQSPDKTDGPDLVLPIL